MASPSRRSALCAGTRVGKAQDMGYVFNVGPEVEFYYFKDAEGTELLDRGGYFDLTSLDYASDLRRTPCSPLRRWASPWSTAITRTAPSQHEIDLRFHRRPVHGRRGHDL